MTQKDAALSKIESDLPFAHVRISKVTYKKVEYTELHVAGQFVGRTSKQERVWVVTSGSPGGRGGRFRKLGDFGTRNDALAQLFEIVVAAHANCETISIEIKKERDDRGIEYTNLRVDGEFIGQARNWGRASWEVCAPRTISVQFGGALRVLDRVSTLDEALAVLLTHHLDPSPEVDPHALKVPEAAAEFAEAVEEVVRQCHEGELSDEDCLDQLHGLLHEHNTPLCDALRKMRGTYVEVEVITKPLQCPDCGEIHIGDELEEFWARGGVGDCPKKGVPKLAWTIGCTNSGSRSSTYREHQVAVEKVLGSEYVSLGDRIRGVTWIFRLDGRVVEASPRPDEWAPCHEDNLTEAKKVAAAVFNAVLDPERADFRLAAEDPTVTNQAVGGLGK